MRPLRALALAVRRVVDAALFGLVVVVLAGLLVARGPALLGRTTLVVTSGSMAPALPVGAAIPIVPARPDEIRVGDVVTIRTTTDGALFTHRVVAIVEATDGRWFETRGDANATPDPAPIPASAVVGRVDVTLPMIGYVVLLLSTASGLLSLMGLGGALLASAWLLDSIEDDRRRPRPGRPADIAHRRRARALARRARPRAILRSRSA